MKLKTKLILLTFLLVRFIFTARFALAQDSLTVYVFLSEECVISQNYTATLNQLNVEFKDKSIGFIGLFPNNWSNDSTIMDFAQKYNIHFKLKTDHFKTVLKKTGVSITPEAAVWSHHDERLIYRGRIDNLYERIGRRRQNATTSELRDALNGWLKDKNIAYSQTKAVGCFINLKN